MGYNNSICVIIIVLMSCSRGSGYPGGVPDSACSSMFPSGHSARPQLSTPPYRIIVPKKTYQAGETIKVMLEAEEGYFKGVYLQARLIGCNVNISESVGVFTANDNELQTRHCFGQVHSTVSHNSNSAKRVKYVYWTAPVNPFGHVILRATFVEDAATFWTNVVSDILVDLQSTDTPTCLTSTVVPFYDSVGKNVPNGEKVVSVGSNGAVHVLQNIWTVILINMILFEFFICLL
ncbi:hypothetical protein SNE40_004360 [Patella caerulea]|uniref:Reelin domain-containing protein n=1 Tax=Patella caerulea TaxID=87958 RepID=A0AAN8PX40_PATCE